MSIYHFSYLELTITFSVLNCCDCTVKEDCIFDSHLSKMQYQWVYGCSVSLMDTKHDMLCWWSYIYYNHSGGWSWPALLELVSKSASAHGVGSAARCHGKVHRAHTQDGTANCKVHIKVF